MRKEKGRKKGDCKTGESKTLKMQNNDIKNKYLRKK